MEKKSGKERLKSRMAYLAGKPFHIEDYPWDEVETLGQKAFRKGVAYHYRKETCIGECSLITDWLLPYRGITDEEFCPREAAIGIWFRKVHKDQYQEILVLPRTKAEAKDYSPKNELDLIAATLNHEFSIDQFTDSAMLQSDIGTGVYAPPMHVDDDALNMLIKTGIRLKKAPFDPYAFRLKSLAVDKKRGVEGANIVNNTRRGFKLNKALSPTKALQFCDVWQMEPAFILRDTPNAMHPMDIPKGKMLVIFPDGIPFKINQDDLIDISDMVAEGIAATAREEEVEEKSKNKQSVPETNE